ncbi:MAG: glycosyltransferase family 4 protein [Chloroflexi bacterium]|jgi:glycosyltransferase involved in cell wall biosynthesis|nr:glycosyltransferase family 4 protein [Chloroflexota bacterium]MBT3671126.1 glycosyltransferase family 4 protein [Chloroflexota bacterium]MBT4004397.1 glycosyltransferase family 4 protein [Chloroflexota bacterium]MBT4304415.1 glycosyltransferase family 4 protein [Chloroflexota bacterium]MBT4534434.1 glycosyltransferase family 4 protein [Chloroflexota bacterium]
MHILLIHQAFAAIDEPGGTRHHEMAKNLAVKGHKITVIASPISYLTGNSAKQRIPWIEKQDGGKNITILRAFTYRALHKSFVHRIFSFFSFMFSSFFIGIKIKNVDLVWGTSPPIFQGLTAWLLARLKSAKFLFEIRDLWPAFAVAVGVLKNPLLIRLSTLLEKFLYRRADQLMVNSPGFIFHIQEKGGKDIQLIPNGADATMFDPHLKGLGFRKKHGLENKFIALYAGAHGMSNDLDVVLDAAKIIEDQKEIAIILLGDGKEKQRLIEKVKGLNLYNLHFIPPVPKDEMQEALAASDLCIAILKPIEMYKTVYPNKVFDYMAAGRPTALAINGVIRQVVEEANAGVFVKPGNSEALAEAILKMFSSPEKSISMGLAGRAYLEKHFDRKVLTEKFEIMIQKMVEQ